MSGGHYDWTRGAGTRWHRPIRTVALPSPAAIVSLPELPLSCNNPAELGLRRGASLLGLSPHRVGAWRASAPGRLKTSLSSVGLVALSALSAIYFCGAAGSGPAFEGRLRTVRLGACGARGGQLRARASRSHDRRIRAVWPCPNRPFRPNRGQGGLPDHVCGKEASNLLCHKDFRLLNQRLKPLAKGAWSS